MAGKKKPQNFEEFRTYCLGKPVEEIIKGYFATTEKVDQLQQELRNVSKPRKVDVAGLRDEIKRLKAIEAKYNRIMEYAANADFKPKEAASEKKTRQPRKANESAPEE